MLDINLIREHPDLVRKALRDRQMDPAPVDEILALDERRRALLSKVEALKAERNAVSKEIGRMKDPAERQSKIEAMRIVGDQIAELDKQVAEVEEQLNHCRHHPEHPVRAHPHRQRRIRKYRLTHGGRTAQI